MEIIIKPIGGGKTIELIKRSAATGFYIICHSMENANQTFHLASELGLTIPYPISFTEFKNKSYSGHNIKGFLIDNADYLIQSMTNVEVKAITLTDIDVRSYQQVIDDAINLLEKDALVMRQLSTEDLIVMTKNRVDILEGLAVLSLKTMDLLKTLRP